MSTNPMDIVVVFRGDDDTGTAMRLGCWLQMDPASDNRSSDTRAMTSAEFSERYGFPAPAYGESKIVNRSTSTCGSDS